MRTWKEPNYYKRKSLEEDQARAAARVGSRDERAIRELAYSYYWLTINDFDDSKDYWLTINDFDDSKEREAEREAERLKNLAAAQYEATQISECLERCEKTKPKGWGL